MKHEASFAWKIILGGRARENCAAAKICSYRRRRIFLLIQGAALALIGTAPDACAQSATPASGPKSQTADVALSHDLSGVWMPYPDTEVPSGTGKNAIDQKS